MDGSIDMNIGMFWGTSVGFLKSVVCQFLPNIAKVMQSICKVKPKLGLHSTPRKE